MGCNELNRVGSAPLLRVVSVGNSFTLVLVYLS